MRLQTHCSRQIAALVTIGVRRETKFIIRTARGFGIATRGRFVPVRPMNSNIAPTLHVTNEALLCSSVPLRL
ncbi:MAG TPA: hypothetical protein VHX39_34450 [Acetobacteraceae bacterium]|nr:hypothetical protein [Acetobacteraceae bacterium]